MAELTIYRRDGENKLKKGPGGSLLPFIKVKSDLATRFLKKESAKDRKKLGLVEICL